MVEKIQDRIVIVDGRRIFETTFPSGEITRSDTACLEPGCMNPAIAGFARLVDGEMESGWICVDHAGKYEVEGWAIILA